MPPALLSGKEALVRGAVREGASLIASPSFAACGADPATVDRARAGGGIAAEFEDAEAAAACAFDAAADGRLSAAVISGRGLPAVEKYFARADTASRLFFLILEEPGRSPDGLEHAGHRELAPLRWAGGGRLVLYVPGSPSECHALARTAARRAGRDGQAAAALYVDYVVSHVREPVDVDAPVPDPQETIADGYRVRDAETLVVAVGIVGRAALTAVRAARERRVRAGLYRPIRLWPAEHGSISNAAVRARHVIVPELSERQLWEPVAADFQKHEARSVVPLWPETGAGRIAPERILAAIERGATPADSEPSPPVPRGIAIRLAGEPAHGLLFAGYVLAEAAMVDRRTVAHVPSLGAATRGPLSGGTIRIAGEPDEDPVVDAADCLLVTSSRALQRYAGERTPEGRLIAEESLPGLPEEAIALPLVRTAIEAGGTPMVVDLVAAAVVTEITGAVSRRALHEAAERLLPARGRPAGMAALDAGLELGKRLLRA